MNSSLTPPYIFRCTDTGQFIFYQRIANAVSVCCFHSHTQRTDNLLRFGFHRYGRNPPKSTAVPSREQNRSSPTLCRTNARCIADVSHRFSSRNRLHLIITAIPRSRGIACFFVLRHFYEVSCGTFTALSLGSIPPE